MRISSSGSLSLGILLIGLMPLLIGCGDDTGGPVIRHPQDFLPQVLGGMAPDGAPTTATTANELQDAINGGYEKYVDHNFQEFVQQFYQGTIGGSQANAEVWIFEMASEQDAGDLHNDDRIVCNSGPEALDDIGEQSVLCTGPGSQTIWFQRDSYWSKVLITVAELFATHIDQKIME